MGRLVITRKIGQSFFINDDISVKILDLYGRNIKLRIDAPDEVVILREELVNKPCVKNVSSN